MTKTNPITSLARIAGCFGPQHARRKARLLTKIERLDRPGTRDLRILHDSLCFMRAYPDDATVLRWTKRVSARLREWIAADRVGEDSPLLADSGFPGSINRCDFSLPVLIRLQRLFPDCLDIDWDEFEEWETLANALGAMITPGECQGLDDIYTELSAWFAAARPRPLSNDLEFLLALFTGADLDEATRDLTFEACRVPIRYRLAEPGAGRCEILWPIDRVHFQKKDIGQERQSLAAQIRRPFTDSLRLPAARGEDFIDLAIRSLSARNLEIRTLTYGNPRDVTLCNCGRGLQVALIGVVPAYRDPLECHYCVLIVKNGVPVAYGPATVWLGCCELGLNLFPEFRGGEIRFIYPQFMRAIHQVLGARYFFLTAYGMGENNPAAIRTGAFWFYRKMGFTASNPEVEALAREEEAKMRADPAHRSSPAMLRRLSHTEAHLDLSTGDCKKLDLAAIGLAQSRFIAAKFGVDRRRAEQHCIRRAARILGETDIGKTNSPRRRAWSLLAPILCMIPDLPTWSAADKKRLLRIVHAKSKPSESGVDSLVHGHARFKAALFGLVVKD
ncbi:MAG: hypothetical protein ACYTG5_07470 [Planctomycetota bacterium]|jgi:hypothetical protein